MTPGELVASLKPKGREAIMDLVAQSGVSVDGWKIKADGQAVKNPRANPKYCYQWAFGGGDVPHVLCVWHHSLKAEGARIVLNGNLREHASKLREFWHNRKKAMTSRARSIDQALRADRFDGAVRAAYEKGVGMRVILVEGDSIQPHEWGLRGSRVHKRDLDSELWFVHAYDSTTGAFRVVRSVRSPAAGAFVDQFQVSCL